MGAKLPYGNRVYYVLVRAAGTRGQWGLGMCPYKFWQFQTQNLFFSKGLLSVWAPQIFGQSTGTSSFCGGDSTINNTIVHYRGGTIPYEKAIFVFLFISFTRDFHEISCENVWANLYQIVIKCRIVFWTKMFEVFIFRSNKISIHVSEIMVPNR